jgi:predicted Zn-dependent protease
LFGLSGIGLAGLAIGWFVWLSPRLDPAHLLSQAQADFQAGRYEQAEATLVRLERLRVATPMDRMARAQVFWSLGRGDDALAELVQIPDTHDLSPLARLLAGRIEVKLGRLRAGERHLLAAHKSIPEVPQVHHELAYLYNLQQRWAELDHEMATLSDLNALDYDRLAHWTKARNVVWDPKSDCEKLAQCVAADPGDRTSRLILAEGLRRMNRFEEADAVLASLPDSDLDARAQRVLLAIDQGETHKAEQLLAEASGDHAALNRLRGQSALKRNDAVSAVRYFQSALKADPDDRATLFGLGTSLQLAGDPKAAEPYLAAVRLRDAVTPLITRASVPEANLDPTLPAKLGAACRNAGRPLEAKAWYRMVIASNPLDEEAQKVVYQLEREAPTIPPRSR